MIGAALGCTTRGAVAIALAAAALPILRARGSAAGTAARGVGTCRDALPVGAPCARDEECHRGAEAAVAFCGEAGRCTAALDKGRPCARDAQCGTGSCTAGICRKGFNRRNACVRDAQCWGGDFCGVGGAPASAKGPLRTMLRCEAALEDGRGCVRDAQCRSSLCDAGTCQLPPPGGGPCIRDAQCGSASFCAAAPHEARAEL